MAEWLRRLTRNQIPSGSVGSSPTDRENFFEFFSNPDFFRGKRLVSCFGIWAFLEVENQLFDVQSSEISAL